MRLPPGQILPQTRREQRGGIRGTQCGQHRAGGRPAGRVLVQTGRQQRTQCVGYVGQLRRGVHGPVEDLGGVPGAEGAQAGGGEDQDAAEGEDIGRRSGLPARHDLFRGHEAGRPHHGARPGHLRRIHRPADTEVDDARPVFGHQDVPGLEVPVDETGVVDRHQRLRESGAQGPHGRLGQHTEVAYDVVQGRRGDVRGGQPGLGGVGVRVEHRRSEEAAHLTGGVGLAPETSAEVRRLGVLGPDDLQRDQTRAG